MNTIEKIKNITSKYLDKNIENTDSTFDELKFDDLDKIELIMRLEEEFDIQITDNDAESFVSIKDLINFLEK